MKAEQRENNYQGHKKLLYIEIEMLCNFQVALQII